MKANTKKTTIAILSSKAKKRISAQCTVLIQTILAEEHTATNFKRSSESGSIQRERAGGRYDV